MYLTQNSKKKKIYSLDTLTAVLALLISLVPRSEEFSEPCQTSKMQHYRKQFIAWPDTKENKGNAIVSKITSTDDMMTIHEVAFNFMGFI